MTTRSYSALAASVAIDRKARGAATRRALEAESGLAASVGRTTWEGDKSKERWDEHGGRAMVW